MSYYYNAFVDRSVGVFEVSNLNYFLFILFIVFSISVVSVLYLVSVFLGISFSNFTSEKLSTYECGFVPFGDSRIQFDVSFYIVSLLFVIFDLELVFLFPWSITISSINYISFAGMVLFFFVLLVGFIYEWLNGSLDS